MFRVVVLILAAQLAAPLAGRQSGGASRPRDIAFRVQMIDPGFSESVAVADFNKDGRLDILSAESWYEAPQWTRHAVRDIPFNGSYIDNFSDLPVDVDGDGYTTSSRSRTSRDGSSGCAIRDHAAARGRKPRSTRSVRPSSPSSSTSTTTASPSRSCPSSPVRQTRRSPGTSCRTARGSSTS